MANAGPVLELERLGVAYGRGGSTTQVLRDVDLKIEPGQSYGLVGESGSGKSTLALAAMRQLPVNGHLTSGRVKLAGTDLYELSETELRGVWNRRMRLVPQDPAASLNPRLRVGFQVGEGVPGDRESVQERVYDMLSRVGLADPERIANSYPHQLSGGMLQRVMIAMALVTGPELLILDEPTTNLDVTTEASILDLITELKREHGVAILYVSHSLAVVSRVCERVAVLYAGELLEDAPSEMLYEQPLHPYTRALLDSVPRLGADKRSEALRPIPGRAPVLEAAGPGCVFADRCPLATDYTREHRPLLMESGQGRLVRCHRWQEIAAGEVDSGQPVRTSSRSGEAEAADDQATRAEPAGQRAAAAPTAVLETRNLSKRFRPRRNIWQVLRGSDPVTISALEGIDLRITGGRVLGLVGESGGGKSTLARSVVGLVPATSGEVEVAGVRLPPRLEERDLAMLRSLQLVFQNSDQALNPYHTVGEILRRPLKRLGGVLPGDLDASLRQLLEAVRLDRRHANRYPAQLSGGERQRVAIARALAARPQLLLLDESVSGLDVSVQAAILNLLVELGSAQAMTYLFISHDLAVVDYIADEVAVIYLGRLMEWGAKDAVMRPPYHPYTEALVSAIPRLDARAELEPVRLKSETPSPTQVPSGCPFHTRCPRFLGRICVEQEPPWRQTADGKRIYCHIPLEELETLQARMPARAQATFERTGARGRDD